MRRLTGLESFFVSAETATNLFHVGAVVLLDPSTAPAGSPTPYEALGAVLEERIHLLAPFRRRLVAVPGGLDHARWVEEERIELDHHLLRAALPRPGGPAELASYAAAVMGRPLDRDRPLWEIHVVEGLEDGLVAAVAKIHHAAIDGLTGIELMASLLDASPEVRACDGASLGHGDAVPSRPTLAFDALRHLGLLLPTAARVLAGGASAVGRVRLHAGDAGAATPPRLRDAHYAHLGGKLTHRRAVGMATVDRESVEQVRAATGATMNDVILTLTAGALRDHLVASGGLPADPLVAFVPVAVKEQRGSSHDEAVNRLSGMLVSLATTIDDPLERLAAVSASAENAKQRERQLGGALFGSIAELLVPLFAGAVNRALSLVGPAVGWPPFNVVVSSFPGSPVPLYCGGSRLVAYHPLGPVVDGSPLNVTATTYRDRVSFGFLACEDTVPDVAAIAGRIPESMRQLVLLAAA